jgi:hypothetical protein
LQMVESAHGSESVHPKRVSGAVNGGEMENPADGTGCTGRAAGTGSGRTRFPRSPINSA